jgi:hypothetical protein
MSERSTTDGTQWVELGRWQRVQPPRREELVLFHAARCESLTHPRDSLRVS